MVIAKIYLDSKERHQNDDNVDGDEGERGKTRAHADKKTQA